MNTRNRRIWLTGLAVGMIGLVVIAVIIGYRTGDAEDTSGTAIPGEQTAPPTTPGIDPGAPRGSVDALGRAITIPVDPAGDVVDQQGKSDSELTSPLAAPKGLEWQRIFDSGIVPFSASDGPTELQDGVPVGMARTPQGAALAAQQIRTRTLHGPREYRERVLQECTSAGPSTVQGILAAGDVVGDDPLVAEQYSIPAAFRIQPGNFSPNAATVEYAFGPMARTSGIEAGEPFYLVKIETLVWNDGAWQLVIDGSLQDEIEVPSIEGWTSWL